MILLLILIIIIAIALLVLLMPIRYRVSADIDNKHVVADIRWMFRLLDVRIKFEEKLSVIIKLFYFMKIDLTDPEEKIKRAKKKAERKRKKLEKKKRKKEKQINKAKKKALKAQKKKAGSKKEAELKRQREKLKESVDLGEEPATDSVKNLNSFKATYSEESDDYYMNMPLSFEEAEAQKEKKKKKEKRDALIYKITKLIEYIYQYDVLDKFTPPAMRLLGKLFPKEISGNIGFGFEDPSITGKIIAVVSMIPFIYDTELVIDPDFSGDNTFVEGNIYVRGYVQIISVFVCILAIAVKKESRAILKIILAKKDKKSKKNSRF